MFWIGFLVSMIGSSMQTFALGWLVVQLADQEGVPERAPLYLGLVAFSRALPGVLLGLVNGVLVDRLDRRRLLFVAEVGALGVATLLAALAFSGSINVAWILALSALGSVITSMEALTRQAVLPGLAGPGLLLSAVGLNSTAVNLSGLLGPLLGGLLIGPLDIGGLIVLNAVSYLAALISLVLIPPQPSVATAPRVGFLASIGEGLTYVRTTAFVRWQLLLFAVGVVLGRPYAELLPAFVDNTLGFGDIELSWLAAAGSAGGLVSTFVAAWLGAARRRGVIFVGSSFGAGISLALLGAQRGLAPALALMALVGFTMILAATLSVLLLQLTTPDHLRGRVISVQTLIVTTGIPSGGLVLGAFGSLVGIDVAMSAGGVLLALASVIALVRAPALRAPTPT